MTRDPHDIPDDGPDFDDDIRAEKEAWDAAEATCVPRSMHTPGGTITVGRDCDMWYADDNGEEQYIRGYWTGNDDGAGRLSIFGLATMRHFYIAPDRFNDIIAL